MPAGSWRILAARDLRNARHPYTRALLDSLPRLDRADRRAADPQRATRPGSTVRPIAAGSCGMSALPERSSRTRHQPSTSRFGSGASANRPRSTMSRFRVGRRRGLRPDRRIRLRQVDRSCAPLPASTRDYDGRSCSAIDGGAAPARQGVLPPRADGLPGPLWLAASAQDGAAACCSSRCTIHGFDRHRGADRRGAGRGRASARPSATATRTSSPAASASASPSRAPDHRAGDSCCWTSRPRRSTSRSRPRS